MTNTILNIKSTDLERIVDGYANLIVVSPEFPWLKEPLEFTIDGAAQFKIFIKDGKLQLEPVLTNEIAFLNDLMIVDSDELFDYRDGIAFGRYYFDARIGLVTSITLYGTNTEPVMCQTMYNKLPGNCGGGLKLACVVIEINKLLNKFNTRNAAKAA